MGWYVAHLLFARRPEAGEAAGPQGEMCRVLFGAPSASAAYDRCEEWARARSESTGLGFVGVALVNALDEEPYMDGTEVGTSPLNDAGVWERKGELIPAEWNIPVIARETAAAPVPHYGWGPAPAPASRDEAIREKLREFIRRHFRDHQLRDDEDIFAMGFVNSLFAVELVTFVEQEFGLVVSDEDLEIDNFRSVDAIFGLIGRKTGRK